jgi:hypothetical protein
MARCARSGCLRWRPDAFIKYFRQGFHVDGAWFCSPPCVAADAIKRLQRPFPRRTIIAPVPPLRLGVLLLHQGAITSSQLSSALASQRSSGLRLGAELQQLGLTSDEAILRGLAAQSSVSYLTVVDPERVRSAPGGLSRDEVRALGVVPFGTAEPHHVLLVACPAPVPRAALAALQELTGWHPEPYLVSDADSDALMQAYGSRASVSRSPRQFVKARDVEEAAREIAAAAAAERSITLTEAHCAPFTWVRVAGPSAISTVLVPNVNDEEICPAPITRH